METSEKDKKAIQNAHIALLADGGSLLCAGLLFITDFGSIDLLIFISISLAFFGCFFGAYSLLHARRARGVASLVLGILILLGYAVLWFALQGMCVIC